MAGKDMNPRTCIVTRTEKSPDEMIRFVLDPEMRVVPDLKRKLPGRGVWVSAEKHVLLEAIRKQLFARGFKVNVKSDDSLADLTENLLRSGLAGLLSMAKKSGVLFSGQKKVEELVRNQAALVLFLAKDKEGDGKLKMKQIIGKQSPETVVYELFTSEELDEVTNGVNTVHVGLSKSGIASKIIAAAGKLEKFSNCS